MITGPEEEICGEIEVHYTVGGNVNDRTTGPVQESFKI